MPSKNTIRKRAQRTKRRKPCSVCGTPFDYTHTRVKACGRAECVNSLKRSATLRRWQSA